MNIIYSINGGIGKCIIVTAVCRAIKKQHLEDQLIVVSGYPEVFLNNPNVDRAFAFGNMSYFKHDFDNVEQVTKEDDEVYGAFGDHTIRTKVEPVPSKAKQILGKDVTDWIWNNYKWFYEQFNYHK